jgi:Transposase DDE domain group 1
MRTATTPTRCAATRFSNWLSIACPRATICARNQPSRGWKTCPIGEPRAGAGGTVAARVGLVLDIDDTFDRVHGAQQLRLFNAHYDDYGFQPIVVFDGEGRFITALLRPGKRRSGVELRGFVRRLVGALRAHWPRVEILLRADSHYASPEVFDWCRANRVDWLFGLARNPALAGDVAALETSTAARFKAAPTRGKVRRLTQFYDAAESWGRVERIIARVEAGLAGTIPASSSPISKPGAPSTSTSGSCARGQAENQIKAWKNHLAADRHFLPYRRGQPVSPVLARRRLLAVVVGAPCHAQTLGLARPPVRHLTAAADQACRPRRRSEDSAQTPPDQAILHAPQASAASCHLNAGASAPNSLVSLSTSSACPITETNLPQWDWIGPSMPRDHNHSG